MCRTIATFPRDFPLSHLSSNDLLPNLSSSQQVRLPARRRVDRTTCKSMFPYQCRWNDFCRCIFLQRSAAIRVFLTFRRRFASLFSLQFWQRASGDGPGASAMVLLSSDYIILCRYQSLSRSITDN